jgi:radical SAM superfamily enzyme YgiQ (UPF0313 family)
MRLALVSPLVERGDIQPPMNLAILAAYVREKYPSLEVRIFDATVDEDAYMKLWFFNPDVLGVTATTPQIKEAYRLISCMKTKFPNLFTVIGGVHVSSLPEEASKIADCVVVGDGEIALARIVDFLRLGIPIPKIIEGIEIEDLDSLPFPAFDLLDMDKYMFSKIDYIPNLKFPLFSIIGSRGCIHKCPFCFNSKRRTKVRYHSADYLIREILFLKDNYGIKNIWFYDNEFIENRGLLLEFISRLKALGLHREVSWACQARATSIRQDTPKMLKEAGCICIFLGIESMAPKSLAFLKCGSISTSDVENAVKFCHNAGLPVCGSFIFGSPSESISEMQQTWRWILRHKNKGLTYFSIGILSPYPGSALYDYALKHNIFSQDNVDYDKISISRDSENTYLLDKAISLKEFKAFMKDKEELLWARKQVVTRKVRGIFTPTFLRVFLRHPLSMWRLLI